MIRRKVLLLELNEVTWTLIDPMIAAGQLPAFARLKQEGVWGSPLSVDLPPQLDPWITWTTLYTGRRQAEHNVYFLQQPPESIKAKRIWEICADRGLRVGVYGSLCSWPPRPVKGFYVPDTFSPDAATYPEVLRSIQEMNLTYTRATRLAAERDGLSFKLRLGAQLARLGLSPQTVSRIIRQLALERFNPKSNWRRVALQPQLNFDFFKRLYQKHRPDFASFHTNHVAHYQHTYWKAMQPELFPQPSGPEEQRVYGDAIRHGYRVADKLLSRILRLLDRDTVLILASSMGQQPYVSQLKDGKPVRQIRSLDKLMELISAPDVRILATMSDQFNVYPQSEAAKAQIVAGLRRAYVDRPDHPLFYVEAVSNGITATLRPYDQLTDDSVCYFGHNGDSRSVRYEDLIYHTGLIKSGCHHPRGVLMIYGEGVRRGFELPECNNLDLAPTMLALLGLPEADSLEGRILSEAFAPGN
ncbi:MAG TPA: alkaline phosphatase family protein [Candidatus Binatia bacterium]|nr:alkaline phosphatase family protein [Candidatus Binatia bacterium]